MKKIPAIFFFSLISTSLFAQNEIGPDGDKLIWLLAIVVALVAAFYFLRGKSQKTTPGIHTSFRKKSLKVALDKNKVYFPDRLNLSVKNTGKKDVDLDRPLLIFDNFWLKRNFRINGSNMRTFYPLYLESGKTHTLEIDLSRFYSHDKRLKRYPKVKVRINDVSGKKLGQTAVYLRKTLIRF